MGGIFKGGQNYSQPKANGLRVNSSLYGGTIPIWYGQTRRSGNLIWDGNFQVHRHDNGKKGKGGQTITYSSNVDLLLGYGPLEGIVSVWRGKDYFVGLIESQTYTAVGPGTVFNFTVPLTDVFGIALWAFPGTHGLNCVVGVSVQINPSLAVTFNDYGNPLGSFGQNFVQAPLLHNNLFPAPNSGKWKNAGIPYAEYNDPLNPQNVKLVFPSSVSGLTVTVWAAYNSLSNPATTPSGGKIKIGKKGASLRSSITQAGLEFEPMLGSGGEGAPLSYVDFSGIGGTNVDLGTADQLPQFSFEAKGLYGYGPWGACNPADVIIDIICSGNRPGAACWNHGLNLNALKPTTPDPLFFSRFGGILYDEPNLWDSSFAPNSGTNVGLNLVRNYCEAYNILVANVLDAQKDAAAWIDELCTVTQSVAVWDGAGLDFITRCEQSFYGNGTQYVAPSAAGPELTLGPNDFMVSDGSGASPQGAVIVHRGRPSTNINTVTLEFIDRNQGTTQQTVAAQAGNMYNTKSVSATDAYDVIVQGAMPGGSQKLDWLHDTQTALNVAWPMLRRTLLVENVTYSFQLKAKHMLLKPYALVLLNDPAIPNSPVPARITSIEYNADFSLNCEAEPFIFGVHIPQQPPIGAPSGGGTPINRGQPVGSVNTPIIFESVPKLSTNAQLWFGLSGADPLYGGCAVWMSTDGGSTYNQVGIQNGSNIMGAVYSANFPTHTDSDAADTLNVDLTQSLGVLPSYTTTQRDGFLSLMYLQGGGTITQNGVTLTIPYELISYSTATLAAASKYTIPPTTRRGVFQTPPAAHNIGTQSLLLSGQQGVFKLDLKPSWLGQALFFKFTTFNVFSGGQQDLADATAYSFTPTGQVGWTQGQNYTVTPVPTVFQGKSGGWPAGTGGDASSTSWTDPTKVYFPKTTAHFPAQDATYAARDSGISVFTVLAGGETAYVTIQDPTQVGEPTGSATLSAFADISTATHWNTPGFTRIGQVTSQPYTGGGGGGGGTGGGGGSAGPGAWDMAIYVPVAMSGVQNNEVYRNRVAHPITFPLNFASSVGDARVTSTGTVTFNVKQNGTQVGTIIFSAGSSTPTFTTVSSTGFLLAAGDEITITWTGPADATLAGFGVTLVGQRS